ncbi:MAG: NAD+ synthase, partial [Proteobacteria bacterium]|nr:NAD+ synthase [Pseudomonadota bacterium]
IVNLNASPFHVGKAKARESMLRKRAKENNIAVAYNNMVGAQDELVFDGRGIIIDSNGKVISKASAFTEELLTVDLSFEGEGTKKSTDQVRVTTLKGGEETKKSPLPVVDNGARSSLSTVEEVLLALELGTKDYLSKNGFSHAIIALSGGIDSALVAAIAERALGAENITTVYMPTRYSSTGSKNDAKLLAENLGIEFMTIHIDDIFASYLDLLSEPFKGESEGTAEENLQARIRGNIIMALSNKFGHLVLTTGNKSEMGVGYATLYGDMAGGFAIIKDVSKSLVYALCVHINEISEREVIPESIITKEPSAELRADQKDSDSLPPYDELDPILTAYVEEHKDIDTIAEMGFPRELVKRVVRMVDKSEYKRRQAPPGIKITQRAYGKDWRMPITNGYEDKS